MVKTGYKFTKQQPNKGSRNMLTKSAASSRPNRTAPKRGDNGNMRSNQTIARLKMYNNGKAIRNKEGKVVGGQFMMADRAGDTKITATTGRIAPDRRCWRPCHSAASGRRNECLCGVRATGIDFPKIPCAMQIPGPTGRSSIIPGHSDLSMSQILQGILFNKPLHRA